MAVDCTDCSLCCQWGDEAQQLAPILTPDEAKVLHHQFALDGTTRLLATEAGDCYYLDRKQNRCSIYEYRPLHCQQNDCIGVVAEVEQNELPFMKVLIQGVRQKYCQQKESET